MILNPNGESLRNLDTIAFGDDPTLPAKGKTDPQYYEGIADAINEIVMVGSRSVSENDVNFIDYDGTIVTSYSKAEFANLAALPANPSHPGLTAQGWNWSLSDAKTYVASYGKLWIGQMYITSDGKTRIYIHLEGRLAPYLGIAINGSAAVDWGDGTSSTVTGSSISTIVNTQHTYSAAGDYVIAIAVTGSMALVGETGSGSALFWTNEFGARNRPYQIAIKKVEIGSNTSIGGNAFGYCYDLASVTIPSGVTSIGDNAFNNCYNLTSVTIPSGVTSIGASAFIGSWLLFIAIPKSVTSIGDYSFRSCYHLGTLTLNSGITSLGTSMLYDCWRLSSIIIPNSVISIGNNAIKNCYNLTFVTIPSGVTSIGGLAFSNCGLTSVTIPSGVTSIGASAFSICAGLTYIKFEGTTPPSVENSNAWDAIPTDCIIYVPRGYLSAYTGAANYPSSSTHTYVEYDP